MEEKNIRREIFREGYSEKDIWRNIRRETCGEIFGDNRKISKKNLKEQKKSLKKTENASFSSRQSFYFYLNCFFCILKYI